MASRRQFLQTTSAALLAGAVPAIAKDSRRLPKRSIAGTDASMAIIGLGNSRAFRSADHGVAKDLLEIFVDHGGNYVDVSGRSAEFVGGLGRDMGASDQLFLGNYMDSGDPGAMRTMAGMLAKSQGKRALDLLHTRDLQGYRAGHDTYRALKEEGLVRFIGVARTGAAGQEMMIQLIKDGLVDFIQVNYSMLEPGAGERLLPLARDSGVGVAISRPFINGNYFKIVSGQELPEWAAEFDCESWAQFSLKFILSNPAVNCVLTETANLSHAQDNLGAGFGRLPDEAMRRRMLAHMRGIV